MVDDLKADSANYERSLASGATRGSPYLEDSAFGYRTPNKVIESYANSVVHQSRQHWGPSAGAGTSSSGSTQSYGSSAYGAPSTGYPESQSHQPPHQQNQPPSAYGQTPAASNYSQQYPQQSAQGVYQTPPAGASASPMSTYSAGSNYTTERPSQHSTQSYGNPAQGSGYQYSGNASSNVPRDQRGYPQAGQPYPQTAAPRYFGSFRPEFLVYN
jgi:hypothetical protein